MPDIFLKGSTAYLIPSFLGFIVFTALTIVSCLMRGGRRRINLLFAALCCMASLSSVRELLVGSVCSDEIALAIDRLYYGVFVLSLPIYVHFVHVFLGITKRKRLLHGILVFSVALSATAWSDAFISGVIPYRFGRIELAGPLYHVFIAGSAYTALYCMITLIQTLRRASNSLQRNRIQYILGGLGVFTLLLLTHYLPVNGIQIYPLTGISFIPGLVLAVGVLKHDLLDVGAAIRKGTLYLVLTGILAGIYILVIYLFHYLFIHSTRGASIIPPLLFAAVIVLVFDPLRKKTGTFVDRFIFKGKYDYQRVLKELSRKMTFYFRLEEICDALLQDVSGALNIQTMSIFVSEKGGEYYRNIVTEGKECLPGLVSGHPLIGYMRNEMSPVTLVMIKKMDKAMRTPIEHVMNQLQCTVIIPLSLKHELVGFMTLGEKTSGDLYVQKDIELLTTIANQTAIAMENARNYSALDALNQDLERRIRQRTEDLETALAEKDRTRDRLIRSESLAAIGQLVAGTAHEMNNPISSASSLIQVSLETLSKGNAEAYSEVLDDLQFSLKELERTKAIIDSLLSLARQRDDYTEWIDIHAVIDDALRVLYNQYKHLDVTFQKHYADGLPRIEGNFASLGQLFINLIKNAVQAFNSGRGCIKIATCFSAGRDRLTICLEDDGTGIPLEYIKDVFKPFFTTKPVGQGTGLGLYISHEIVKKHNGEINISSHPERGTLVTIDLPRQRLSPGSQCEQGTMSGRVSLTEQFNMNH